MGNKSWRYTHFLLNHDCGKKTTPPNLSGNEYSWPGIYKGMAIEIIFHGWLRSLFNEAWRFLSMGQGIPLDSHENLKPMPDR